MIIHAATLDQMSGAIEYVRKEWGDYGYQLAYQGADLFAVICSENVRKAAAILNDEDRSPPTFLINRNGHHYTA